MSATSHKYIVVAKLLRPQGRRGEVLAEPLSDLAGIFVPGRRLELSMATPKSATGPAVITPAAAIFVTVVDSWTPTGRNAGRVVLKLSGVDSISAAEALTGRDLLLEEGDLPARDADTFLVRDLLGCTLYDGDKPAGEIVDVQFPMSCDGRTRLEEAAPLLVVSAAQHREPVLVPFVKAWLHGVDLSIRRVSMTLPDGLFTLPAPSPQEGPESEE